MNRWVDGVEAGLKKDRGVRPYLSSHCDNLKDAEYWRRQIIREITGLVRDIQNAGLGEHTIRDMNDAINKKIKEKGHWERRIVELGGPNYKRKRSQFDGSAVGGKRGYMYFGAAKNLPGVRELFAEPAPKKKRRTRHEMYQGIDPDYYGYRDEDDGVLLECEAQCEALLKKEALETWNTEKRKERDARKDLGNAANSSDSDESEDETNGDVQAKAVPKAHIPIPSQDEIEKIILERKKEALLMRFADENFAS
eukprot:g178.t1